MQREKQAVTADNRNLVQLAKKWPKLALAPLLPYKGLYRYLHSIYNVIMMRDDVWQCKRGYSFFPILLHIRLLEGFTLLRKSEPASHHLRVGVKTKT